MVLGLYSLLASAQSIPTFTDSIYPVATQYNIKYGSSRNALHLNQNLYMDMYSPVGLEVASPVLYLFHGGGFVSGSKNDARLIAEAKYFAGCGYTVFVCDYRLGWKLTYNDTARAIQNSHVAYYRGVADGFTAIRYGKYYADILNLDTSNFFIAGTSAGGLISVGVGYLDQNEVESFYATPIKSSGNNLTKYESTEIKGVISYWGGMFDTTIFVNETTPNICFHGALDEVVYYNEGRYKGVIPIYGGYKVNKLSDENNIPSILHTFPNAHHGVSTTSLQWDSCLNETKYWMKSLMTPAILPMNRLEYPSDDCGNINMIEQPFNQESFTQSNIVYSSTKDTLVYNGANAINVVIMGDGFLASEQDTFKVYANKIVDKFYNTKPFSDYKKSFNFYIVSIQSDESGIKHPVTAVDCSAANPQVPYSNPITPLGCTFDYGNIHRLVYAVNQSTINQVLTTNFPDADYGIILANSNFYGGSGGTYPVATKNVQSSDIMIHEFGHRFANLADEYTSNTACGSDHPNVTNIISPLKWDSIVHTYYLGANYCNTWYRPEVNCKMQNLSYPFCKVCDVVIENKIKSLTLTTPRRVLSEYICATTCAPCTPFSPIIRNLMTANSSKVAYTEKHTSIPSPDPYYLQSNPYSQWYMIFNGIVSNPVFYWDGKFHFTNDANQACFDSIQAVPSYLQISGTYHLNSVKDSIFITVNLNPLANISGNLYLHTNVKFTDPANHDAYAFSSVYGETAIADLIANNGVSYTFKQKIPTTFTQAYSKDSLKVIIYVQTHTNSNPNVNDPPTHIVYNSAYAVKTGVTYPPLNVANVIGNNICPLSGFVNLTTTGGSGIYTYLWSNGATTEDITGIGSGTYTCTITSTDNQIVSGTYYVANIAIGNVNGISVTVLAGGKIKITCSSVPNANKYQYQYRLVGATTWSNKEVSNTTLTFSNLLYSTSYQVRMRARCKTGTIYKNGQWSATYIVTTLANRVEEPIAPVITDNVIYVYDIYGRLMYKGLETPNTSNYINGIYFFKVNGLVTRKIIIN